MGSDGRVAIVSQAQFEGDHSVYGTPQLRGNSFVILGSADSTASHEMPAGIGEVGVGQPKVVNASLRS